MRILKVQVNGPLPNREREGGWGDKPEYPEKNPDNQPENLYYIIIRGENSQPQQGIEPAPSNIGDKFAWSERAGSNPLNYWLPLQATGCKSN